MSVDIFWASGPCQPYTVARRGVNSDTVPAEHHRGYDATFSRDTGIVGMVQKLQPHVFGTEQVLGFAMPKSGGDGSDSYKDDFASAIMATTRSGTDDLHFSGYASVKLDSQHFMEGSRPRFQAIANKPSATRG